MKQSKMNYFNDSKAPSLKISFAGKLFYSESFKTHRIAGTKIYPAMNSLAVGYK
jgi:hypothetical protein